MWKAVLAVALAFSAYSPTTGFAQQAHAQRDPCEELRFMPLGGNAPTISVADVAALPQCFDGKFVRIVGIYRIAFENSDLYDPTTEHARAWVEFGPYYSAVERCSPSAALRRLDREKGGTFGFVALGVVHTGGGFGHMNGWMFQFDVICVEEAMDFSDSGSLFEFQKRNVQTRILEWYKRKRSA